MFLVGEYIDVNVLPVQYGGDGQLPSFNCETFLSQDLFFDKNENEAENKDENKVEGEDRNENVIEMENELNVENEIRIRNENGNEIKNGLCTEKTKVNLHQLSNKDNHNNQIGETYKRKLTESTVRKDPRIYS